MEPLIELPDIRLTKEQAEDFYQVLSACNEYGREMFKYIAELWSRAGFVVSPKPVNVGLGATLDGKRYSLAAMIPVGGERHQLLTMGWNSLRRDGDYPTTAIDEFQAEIQDAVEVHLTESSAHIWVVPGFDRPAAEAVVQALAKLARSRLANPEPQPEFVWTTPPRRPDIRVGTKTLVNVHTTLSGCDEHAQAVFGQLLEGWGAAGGTIHCHRAGRIYLRFRTRDADKGPYGLYSHQFNLAVLAAPRGKHGARIEVAWNTGFHYLQHIDERAAAFEAVVSLLPGHARRATVTQLALSDEFEAAHADLLLKAMVKLSDADRLTQVAGVVLCHFGSDDLTIHRQAEIQDGSLTVWGQDTGPLAEKRYGTPNVHYWLVFDEKATTRLGALLTVSLTPTPAEILGALREGFGSANGVDELMRFCRSRKVKVALTTRV